MKKLLFTFFVLGLLLFVGASCSEQEANSNINEEVNLNSAVDGLIEGDINFVPDEDAINASHDVIDENTNTYVSGGPGYYTYEYDFFNFEYPADWTAKELEAGSENPNDKVQFNNEDGDPVALLTCPYIITGYEGGDTIHNEEKDYSDGYSAQLIVVDYSNDLQSNGMGLVIMKKGDYNSCQLFSSDSGWDFEELKIAYKYIYDNLQ